MNGFFCQLICHYIKCKIRAINNRIRDSVKLKRRLNIRRMHSNLNSIYTEINEYNEIFFSKYYLSVWLFLGSFNIFLLYIAIFQDILLIFVIIYMYAFVLLFSLFSFLILNASSVNSEANKSYKLLNSLFVCYFSAKIKDRFPTFAKFKVILHCFYHANYCWKDCPKGELAFGVGSGLQSITSDSMRYSMH